MTLRIVDGAPTITAIKLTTVGRVPGIDEAKFQEAAAAAKAGCPVSKALAGVPDITPGGVAGVAAEAYASRGGVEQLDRAGLADGVGAAQQRRALAARGGLQVGDLQGVVVGRPGAIRSGSASASSAAALDHLVAARVPRVGEAQRALAAQQLHEVARGAGERAVERRQHVAVEPQQAR